ncbi:hypothetical protein P154DRAFT_525201 [Amniculicola lignicola CBS 123094]|uniref:Uncharacterized protein n=1 Tax=Amniculicola lignicola CBS 123094 TaxID=1392246 RepID=A0A6A5W6T2_9PLEO|nr:hypothetical protein P154DRAFT_525201 [Amniculicola lignicola CBS 123094]
MASSATSAGRRTRRVMNLCIFPAAISLARSAFNNEKPNIIPAQCASGPFLNRSSRLNACPIGLQDFTVVF